MIGGGSAKAGVRTSITSMCEGQGVAASPPIAARRPSGGHPAYSLQVHVPLSQVSLPAWHVCPHCIGAGQQEDEQAGSQGKGRGRAHP